jgi:membrane protein required for colicin V production
MGWVDIALLSLLALSTLVGLLRGFVFEVLSLMGWVVAYVVAQWFGPDVAPHVPVGMPGSGLNLGVSFALTFVAALIVWGLVARLVRVVVKASPLSVPDRVLGAGFGAMRALVLSLALATVVTMTPAVRSAAWQASRGAGWLHAMLIELKPVLPTAVAQHLPERI